VRPQSINEYVLVDTYYRQLHMPSVYFNQLIDVIAIPDYTCNYINTTFYTESANGGNYVCYCNGNNFNGLPRFTVTYYKKNVEFEIAPSEYLFSPYLNYTSRLTDCILSLAGPTTLNGQSNV
jgi:hypothetical protein